MRRSELVTFCVLICLVAASCLAAEDRDFETLTDWMIDSFSSEAQAAADSAYYDIRLEMARIWPERRDAC